MAGVGMALLCMLYPESQAKQERCLSLLRRSAREYYPTPAAKCTTWSYFTPFPPPKPGNPNPNTMIGGLEIYTTKSALQAQVDDPVYFQSYHETVEREGLYAKAEKLEAWYSHGGFVAREAQAKPYGGGVLISVTRMVCKDRGEVEGVMRPFADWVRANEPDVLTYATFTRPKAPREILLFVRYKDGAALKGHSVAPEHQEVVKKLSQMCESNIGTSTTLWKEVDDSFVTNAVGASTETAKL